MDLANINWDRIFTICAAVFGVIPWFKQFVETSYGRKRDWGHLKNNYQQMSENLLVIDKGLDSRFDRIDLVLARMEGKLDSVLYSQPRPHDAS